MVENGSQSGNDAPEIAELREELRREHDIYLRALADFDNYRKRVEREQAGAARAGKRALIAPLLDLMDGFERALQNHDNTASGPLVEGVQLLRRQLESLLQAEGITPLPSVGAAFDPALHEAIGTAPADGAPPGRITEELQRGYRWGDEVLRPARVRVTM